PRDGRMMTGPVHMDSHGLGRMVQVREYLAPAVGRRRPNGEEQMGRRVTGARALAPLLFVTLLIGCAPRTATPLPTQASSASPDAVEATDVTEHESGPESPIAYGFQVPRAASQVGPPV